jgi:cell division protein FtsB
MPVSSHGETGEPDGLGQGELEKYGPGNAKWTSLLASFSGRILWVAFLAVVVAVVGYLYLSEAGVVRSKGLLEKKRLLEIDNLRLEEENRQLSARLERIRSDPGYLEDEARKKLGLVRPDEVIFRLAEEPELSDEEVREKLD